MTTLSYAVTDSATMLRRNLRRLMRYPAMAVSVLGVPVILLLLFVYVLGGTLGAGLGHRYIDYLAPGIIVLAATSISVSTAVAVNVDMTEGIMNRFRTMAIARTSVLTGHVASAVIQAVLSAGLVAGVAVLVGFRPTAGPAGWIAAFAVIAMIAFALTWISVALGLVAKTPETASNLPMPLQFLPFLGSTFVPPASMAPGVRWFAEYQPFTPMIETVRGLLTGTAIGDHAVITAAWCAGLALAGYLWARRTYNRGGR
ncbi:MAG TPA: ABC transporter permease [Streptosporangiaceae bacterium]|nr:ABC transporter permease [Streptosporangiaceae bacterium]